MSQAEFSQLIVSFGGQKGETCEFLNLLRTQRVLDRIRCLFSDIAETKLNKVFSAVGRLELTLLLIEDFTGCKGLNSIFLFKILKKLIILNTEQDQK